MCRQPPTCCCCNQWKQVSKSNIELHPRPTNQHHYSYEIWHDEKKKKKTNFRTIAFIL
ncbi:hypothetical protein BDZ91DRAFT_443835 [Kalaharituber pfeilii]|nr:hypothetical protein BDZ91DRAFT_443835 [Kalaharituber pfeilii]